MLSVVTPDTQLLAQAELEAHILDLATAFTHELPHPPHTFRVDGGVVNINWTGESSFYDLSLRTDTGKRSYLGRVNRKENISLDWKEAIYRLLPSCMIPCPF